MRYTTPEISWHSRDPLYSVDLQCCSGHLQRLATCGTDKVVRMWEVKLFKSCSTPKDKGVATVEFLSTLNRHSRTVNVVRFSPDGTVLASGSDDAVVILWKLADTLPSANLLQDDDEENRETWTAFKALRSHLEDVYDINWSADSKLLLSGSVDNTAILWDVKKGQKLWMFTEHKGFVQGVAIDPLGQYLATLSDDRSLRLFSLSSRQILHDVKRLQVAGSKSVRMFHSAETMKTFFRRLDFSPDGMLLVVPAGYWENTNAAVESSSAAAAINTSYVFCRSNLTRPVMSLVGPSKPTLVVRFCPKLFELRKIQRRLPLKESNDSQCEEQPPEWMKYETLFRLPYRMIFAVASEDAIYLYDTQLTRPFAYLTNLHYHTLSDLTWSHDGQLLVVSSTDGYCTLITFDENELGTVYKKCEVVESAASAVTSVCQSAPESVPEMKVSRSMCKEQSVALPGLVSKEESVVQPGFVAEPVPRSPQRKKARRVVLQTLSTNVDDFTVPQKTTSVKQEATTKCVISEPNVSSNDSSRPPENHGDAASEIQFTSQVSEEDYCKTRTKELMSTDEPESMDICSPLHIAETPRSSVDTESSETDLHLILELSSDNTTSNMMPPPSTSVLSASTRPSAISSTCASPVSGKLKPPRRVQLTTLK